MLPGKKYKPEDFLRILWTRKWLITIPAVVLAAGTFAWTSRLPDRYRSSTTILVVPQRVPQAYVRSTVTAGVAERLQTISQQILSRTRLERIIEEFNLYQRERQTMIMEDVIEMMRTRDVKLSVPLARRRNQEANHFSVSFESAQPRTAMLVADRLADMFVRENLQDREVLADSTNQFLQAQLEDARRRLLDHEAKLEAFRSRNAGQLPGQVQSNLQMLQMTQGKIQANEEAANRERDRVMTLEASIAEAIANGNSATAPVETKGDSKDALTTGTVTQQLAAARAGLKNLEMRLKPSHPDIGRAKRVIAELEAKADEEAAARQAAIASGDPADPIVSVSQAVANKISPMRLEVQRLRRSLDTRKAEDERLRQVLAAYAGRLETGPKLESELTELMRDYDTLQDQYKTLLRKSEDSKMAVNLERRQIGEQFKIIDGARLPERPVSPDRVRLNLMGLFAGLSLGIALVALLEYRDTTLKTDEDVVTSLALPVLAVIPAMITTADRRRIKRRRLVLGLSAAAVVLLAVVAVVAWRMQLLQALVR
jgi:polysaccharide chain length determinant protein (PEP-CTERM system associated)